LKDIQNQPQTLQPLPPSPSFPPTSYPRSFLLPRLADELCKPRSSNLLTSPPPPIASAPPLAIETYEAHWTALLAWELDKLATDKEGLVLWKNPIKILDWGRSEFVLEVPGLRENYPRLETGDLAHLRMIFEDAKTGSGRAFEARVNALRKREGLVRAFSDLLLNRRITYQAVFFILRTRSVLSCTQIAHTTIHQTDPLDREGPRAFRLLRGR
jgi:hypothetical protein